MLPPGLSFTAVSQKAIAASKTAKLPRSYWSWDDMLALNANGTFPYTPASGLLFGLVEAIDMLHEEGLDRVFARHERLAEAVRRAVRGWGLETWCRDAKYHSPVVTAVAMPDAHNADAFRKLALEKFDISLGTGLNKLAGKAFRIGHLGYTNELTVLGALCGRGDDAGACRRSAREGGRRRGDGLPRRDRAARNRPRRLVKRSPSAIPSLCGSSMDPGAEPRDDRCGAALALAGEGADAGRGQLDLAALAERHELHHDAALDLGDGRRGADAQPPHIALAGRAHRRRHFRRELQLTCLRHRPRRYECTKQNDA